MTLTDNNILQKLYEEQKALVARLMAVRLAIIGFNGEISNADLQELLDIEGHIPVSKQLIIPSVYSENLPRTQKIAFAINELGKEAYVSEIFDKILELEPNYTYASDEKKIQLKRNITLLTSYLYRDGRLKVKKDGNRYKYRLIE